MKTYRYCLTASKTWGTMEAQDIWQAFDKVRGQYPNGGLCVYAPQE